MFFIKCDNTEKEGSSLFCFAEPQEWLGHERGKTLE